MNQAFSLKKNFNCESRNFIYVIIFQGCNEEYIGKTGCFVRERISIYGQHKTQPQYQQIKLEEHLGFYSRGEFEMFPFLQMRQEKEYLKKILGRLFHRSLQTSFEENVLSCVTN